jgi:serine/threonine-protein kinase
MPPRRVRSILADVLGALARAHAAGVLHRDIKPGNVLVAPVTNAMKLADFGIAKTAGAAHTATGQIFGTMAYMSPERVAGAPASASDDMYAVGVMGYEALTGRRPYPQENPAVLVRALLDSPPPPIAAVMPDLDPALAAVIDRAMARDVSLRFENADHMRAVLDGTVPVGPPLSTHAGFVAPGQRPATKVMPHPPVAATNYFVPPPVPRKPMSRRRKLMVAGAALVALIVVALALALDPSSSQQPMQPISSSTPMPPPPPPPTSSPAPTPPVTPQVPGPGGKKGNGNGHGGHGGKRGD